LHQKIPAVFASLARAAKPVLKNCQREDNSSSLRWCPHSPAHLERGAIGGKIAAAGLNTGAESETP